MNGKAALFLAIVIVGLFVADAVYLGWDLPTFVGKRLAELIDWIAFWR